MGNTDLIELVCFKSCARIGLTQCACLIRALLFYDFCDHRDPSAAETMKGFHDICLPVA